MVRIREAEAGDLDRLLELYSLLFGRSILEKNEETVRIWNHIMTDKMYHVIVAEENGVLVSTCTCVIIPNLTYDQRSFAVVENIVTKSEYRAQGFATACLEEAQRIAEANNCFRIMLATQSKLQSTHKFYERLGYSKDDMTAFTQWL